MNPLRIVNHCWKPFYNLVGFGRRFADHPRSNEAEESGIRFRWPFASQDPKSRVRLRPLPPRSNKQCIDILPDVPPEGTDFFPREPRGTLTVEGPHYSAMGE